MNVKGLKIDDILNIDLDTFNSLNESDLRHITSRLVSASNKRIRRLEKYKLNTPSYQHLGDTKRFSTKLGNISKQQKVNRLRTLFSNMRSFLTSETSTIGGYRKFLNKTYQRLSKELNLPIKDIKNKLNIGKLFDTLHKAQEKGIVSSYRGSEGSLQARNIITEIMTEKGELSENDLLDALEDELNKQYEQNEMDDIEDYYDLDDEDDL